MLRDITIGQHFPGDSLVHKFDPRMKLVLTIVYIILLFAASNPLGLTLSLVFLVAMYGVAKIPFKLITKSLKPILPIILFTAVLNLFFVSGEGEALVHFWVLNIFAQGLRGLLQGLLHGRVITPCIEHAHGLRTLARKNKSKRSHISGLDVAINEV